MKVLPNVKATAEQLAVLAHNPKSTLIIRGAAGSGKTTTALLRLHVVTEVWQQQFARAGDELNVLVLTFNRTLAGYVEALAEAQVESYGHVNIRVATFGEWAQKKLGYPEIVKAPAREQKLKQLGSGLGLPPRFLISEVDYVLGRFLPANWTDYLTIKREGRGLSPPMPQKLRQRLLEEVVRPFANWKQENNLLDWSDVAVAVADEEPREQYHVVVVDETQDFHANQVRAVLRHLAPLHTLTFVMDGAQRIYPHFFHWNEVGVPVAGADVRKLTRNYRNTRQIAAFAQPLIEGVDVGPDGAMPDFSATAKNGPMPTVITGKFSAQMTWAIDYINSSVDLENDSVVFLHPQGWFDEVRNRLMSAGLDYEDLTRERDWPTGPTNIGLSTMNSAKGLEFDHVLILGLSDGATPHGKGEGDSELERWRRLVAMAVGRARKSVVIGYKPGEASTVVHYFKPGTYMQVKL